MFRTPGPQTLAHQGWDPHALLDGPCAESSLSVSFPYPGGEHPDKCLPQQVDTTFKWEDVCESCKWKALIIISFKARGKTKGDG